MVRLTKTRMSSPATTESLASVSDGQRSALLTLLLDEDGTVYQTVRAKILSYGDAAVEWLRPQTLSNDSVLRRRSLEIIRYLSRQQADTEFLGFCLSQGEDLDLEEGSLLLAKTEFPGINVAGYQALLDSYAGKLRDEIEVGSGVESILATINHLLFTELGFAGNGQDYYDPENSYLNRVIDRRMGNPISLCLIYLFVTRRLRLPVAGIGMPGHFLVRFQSSVKEIFIDPFNRGKLLTKADCIKYLIHTSGFQESYLAPVSPRRILLRTCSNLHQIYSHLALTEEIARLQRYIIALAK